MDVMFCLTYKTAGEFSDVDFISVAEYGQTDDDDLDIKCYVKSYND
jgi:hypothetical protein